MMVTIKQFLGYGLLITILIASSVILLYLRHTESLDVQPAPANIPDSYAKQVTLSRYAPNGKLHSALTSHYILHYDKARVTNLYHPIVYFKNPDHEDWIIRSNYAQYNDSNDIIEFWEAANIQQQASAVQPPTEINTAYLRYNPLTSIANTATKVTIIQPKNTPSESLTITADSAIFKHNEGISTFTDQVKIQQGSTVITGKKMIAYTNHANKLTKLIIDGNPARYQTTPNVSQSNVYASAQQIYYFPSKKEVDLIGNATATQNQKIITGPHLKYFTEQKLVISPPNDIGQTTIIYPPDPSAQGSQHG